MGLTDTPDRLEDERAALADALPAYEIGTVLGRGAYAVVYAGRHIRLGREVAIKRLSPEVLRDADARDRFAAEARLLASLDHPHVVRVHDYMETERVCALVMERLRGGTLADRLSVGRPPLARACAITVAALHGLEHAHRHGVLHRDVKPENLLFGDQDLIKVADFGIAKVLGAHGARMTMTANALGTPAFMAPEQVSRSAGPLSPATDVWAVGALLYELLAGVPPFARTGELGDVLLRRLADDPPWLGAVAPEVPDDLAEVVMRALARNPEQRYPTAGAFAEALEPAADRAAGPGGLEATGIPIHRTQPLVGDTSRPTLVQSTDLDWAMTATCPYRGLFAFREEDAPFFFGREAIVDDLLASLARWSFLAIIGASGSGKSSLVLAGVMPRLRAAGGWEIAHFRPGPAPWQSLAAALVGLLERAASETDRLVEAEKLAAALRSGRVRLAGAAARICEKAGVSRFLLVVDQFEEVYTLADAEDRDRLLEQLLGAADHAREQSGPLTLVLTLRADFLGHALSFRPLADALQGSDLKLGPMNRDELRAVIEKPAHRSGVRIEQGLTERMLDAVGDEPGDLPLLEFALTQLWAARQGTMLTHEAYNRMGGAEQALARYADEIYEALTPDEQDRARAVLVQLVRPGEGTQDTRRVAARSEVGEDNWPLVGRLATARLVVTGGADGGSAESVELVHEALITRWGRLREWMASDRLFRAWQERLRAAMSQWEASGRDEGALLRGGPLTEARAWAEREPERLRGAEAAFIEASMVAADALERERAQARARELEQAKALAEEQRSRAEQRARYIRFQRLGAVLLAIALVVAVFEAIMASHDRDDARHQRRIALTQALAAGVDSQVAEHQPERAALLALLAYRFDRETGSKLRAEVDHGLRAALGQPAFSHALAGHDAEVAAVAVSPDGRTIASAGAGGPAADHTVRLRSLAQRGRTVRVLRGHRDAVNGVAFSPDGRWLASASTDETVRVWNLRRPRAAPVALPENPGGALAVAFAPSGRSLAVAGADGTVRLWSVRQARPPQPPARPFTVLPGHKDGVLALAYRPDGGALATGDGAGTVRIWDLRRPRATPRVVRTGDEPVLSLAYAPRGGSLAWTTAAGAATLLDGRRGTLRAILRPKHDLADTYSITFSRDGRSLALGDYDTQIKVWQVARLDRPPRILNGHVGPVRAVAFTPDGRTLVSGSADHTLRVWPLRRPTPFKQVIPVRRGEMSALVFSHDRRLVAAGAQDTLVRVWDRRRPTAPPLVLRGHRDEIRGLSFSPDDRLLAASGADPVVLIWDLERPSAPPRRLVGHRDRVLSVEFAPDGKTVVTGSDDGTIRLWSVDRPAERPRVLAGHADAVRAVAVSPDGRYLASGGEETDDSVWVWNLQSLDRRPLRLRAPLDILNVLTWAPDSRQVAAGGSDGLVRIWDVRRPRAAPIVLEGHTSEVEGLRFLPGSRMILSASDDRTVRLWDLRRPAQLPVEMRSNNELEALDLTTDGRIAGYTGDEGVVSLERIRTSDLAAEVCREVWRNLTRAEWERFVGPDIPYGPVCPALRAGR